MGSRQATVAIVSAVLALTGASGTADITFATPRGTASYFPRAVSCARIGGPEYYAFDLVTTSRVPGSGLAIGRAEVSVSGSTPFSIALSPDGSYEYEVHISIARMKRPRDGVLVAWLATRELDRVQRIGPLDQYLQAKGTASWNKFLVVVTLEPNDDPTAQRWTGPVALRGMSRSGMMHTMAGHGAFQEENCAAYGYDD